MSIDLRSDDLEVYEQTFFILHDLRLRGGDAQVVRGSGPAVFHHCCQRIGDRGLHLVGVRIIGKDIALVEILQIERGVRLYDDRYRRDRNAEQGASLVITDGAANCVSRVRRWCRSVTRNERPLG